MRRRRKRPKKYFEYRGVRNAVYAEVIVDTAEAYETGPVKDLAGVSEIGKEGGSSNEMHFYDNLPAIVIDSVGSDEISISTSGIPQDVLADINGQYYNETKGLLVEQEPIPRYFAFGYITDKTDGTAVLVWRLKGKFSVPGLTAQTKDNGTDANGQELTFTGINTVHKFELTEKTARAVNVDTSVEESMPQEKFFQKVQTPDTVLTTVLSTDTGTIFATDSGLEIIILLKGEKN